MRQPTAPVLDLSRHPSDRTAFLLPDDRHLTYGELAVLVAERAATWGPERRLVLVEGANTLDSVLDHLAALTHGHVALLVPDGRPDQLRAMVEAYDPDVVCARAATDVRRSRSAHDLHPDLVLLLSTSGSTGSPKLVRLSARNVASNAAAIADYLALTPADRAITTLPLHYCYGLSVLHSHLHAGASVVLTDHSVVDPCFWDLLDRTRATSLSGVPYTFDLLEHAGFADRELRSLRFVTQAGGRLAPHRVAALAALGQERGWELFVMYGQTEATARMAWLPPELAATHPAAIGQAIPGGRLRLEPVPESDDTGVGELVYSGPNVMMGYAAHPRDLARGAELDELRTGDLARLVDGQLEVVGRRNRYAKVFGLRLDLERLERQLEEAGAPARCVAAHDQVHAFARHGRHADRTRETIAAACGLPGGAVRVHVVPDLPTTASGKVDLAALTTLAERACEQPAVEDPAADLSHEQLGALVADHYGQVLGVASVQAGDTFVSLGGDSLSYVELATRLERLLGPLPLGWHTHTIGALSRPPATAAPGTRTPGRPTGEARSSGRRGGRAPRRSRSLITRLDTTVALRAVAIVLIVASHVDLVGLEGGAHLLLALAGLNFARFQLGLTSRTQRLRHGASGLAQLVAPSVLWIGAVALVAGTYRPSTVFLVHGFVGSQEWTRQWQFWFLEALLWITVAVLALVAVPTLHRLERRSPFGFPLALLALTAALRYALVGLTAGPTMRYSAAAVAFFFVLGWLAGRAASPRQRWLVTALGLALVPGFFGEPLREAIVVAGLLLLVWAPSLPWPRPLLRPTAALASASLFIYLTQWQVYPPLEDAGHPVAALLATFAVGIGYGHLVRPLQRRIGALVREPGRPTLPATPGPVPALRTVQVSVPQTPATAGSPGR